MMKLFLDGKLAIPASPSIKVTKENPYFTKSSSYTYDVDLPLDIPENRAIFGWLARLDQTKVARTLSARLEADDTLILEGTANILSVTESVVKVQLLGDTAAYTYDNKVKNLYIDELDLGDWFTSTWPDRQYWDYNEQQWKTYDEAHEFKGDCFKVYRRTLGAYQRGYNGNLGAGQYPLLFGDTLPWVAYPVINSTTGNGFNIPLYSPAFISTNNFTGPKLLICGYTDRGGAEQHYCCFSPQPYVWYMAEKIAAATGFALDRADNALYNDPFLRRIFIVTANPSILCNYALPHWTVNEWWEQVEKTFGVIMDVDYASKKMSIRDRRSFFNNAESYSPRLVADSFSAEIGSSSTSEVSADNIGYADDNMDSELYLSDFIRENALINTRFANIVSLCSWAEAIGADGLRKYKNMLFQCADGRHYIIAEDMEGAAPGFYEVDMFRPRKPKADKGVDFELKFVPAKRDVMEATYRTLTTAELATTIIDVLSVDDYDIEIPINSDDYIADEDKIDIEKLLSGEDDESTRSDERSDLIHIAIADNAYEGVVRFTTSEGVVEGTLKRPIITEHTTATIGQHPRQTEPGYGLGLNKVRNQTNLYEVVSSQGVEIKTGVRLMMSFLKDEIPDVSAVFYIHGKRYVCEKLELTATADGMSELVTGYFYELLL